MSTKFVFRESRVRPYDGVLLGESPVPGVQGRLVVVSKGEMDMIADLEGDGGGVGISEPLRQCCRRYLGRRSPAAGGHQFVRRGHDGTAKYPQHICLDLRNWTSKKKKKNKIWFCNFDVKKLIKEKRKIEALKQKREVECES